MDELTALLKVAGLGPREVLSTRSKAYRSDPNRYDKASDEELVQAMVAEPTLLRRPIVLSQSGVVVGYDRGALESVIAEHG